MPPRKKATAIIAEKIAEANAAEANAAEAPVSTEPPKKAKREKKSTKHPVVAVVTADGIQGSFQTEMRRPLIAHLPIRTSEIQFHDQPFVYDPKPPETFEAFNAGDIDPFAAENTYEALPQQENKEEITGLEEVNTVVETPVKPVTVNSTLSMAPRKEYGPSTLLVQFAHSKNTKCLPEKTDLACFWCCETFADRPCVIPTQIVEEVWQVYGCFCTPQCCMAYLLSEVMDTHTRWERIALLNRLYSASTQGRIYPAPKRETLQRFGGPIKAEDFRALCDAQRVRVDVHMPPMVSILASMDTKPIDFYETSLRSTTSSYPSVVAKQPDEATSLKLKRSKPLKDKESTLDACFQIVTR